MRQIDRPVEPSASRRPLCCNGIVSAIVASLAIGCASESRPKPAPAKDVAAIRTRADQVAAEGKRLKNEGVALDARGQSAESRRRVAEGERKLTEAKMLRDKALLNESPVPVE